MSDGLEKQVCVYRIAHVASGKIYFGITTKTPRKRWLEHLRDVRNPQRKNRPLYRAIRKYGARAFAFTVLCEGTNIKNACQMERELIARHGTMNRRRGYNLTPGGDIVPGWTQSAEVRRKISLRNKGRKLTAEHRARLSAAVKGRHHSAATIEKCRVAKLGKSPMTDDGKRRLREFHTGRPWSDASRKKASEAHKRIVISAEQRDKMDAGQRTPEARARMSALKIQWHARVRQMRAVRAKLAELPSEYIPRTCEVNANG